MYAVLEYLNYHKDMSLHILHVVPTFQQADKMARKYAKREYGHDYTDRIIHDYLTLDQAKSQYTIGRGQQSKVYAVVVLPPIQE